MQHSDMVYSEDIVRGLIFPSISYTGHIGLKWGCLPDSDLGDMPAMVRQRLLRYPNSQFHINSLENPYAAPRAAATCAPPTGSAGHDPSAMCPALTPQLYNQRVEDNVETLSNALRHA